MFDLGIESVSVGIAYPGARRIVVLFFRDGTMAFRDLDPERESASVDVCQSPRAFRSGARDGR